VHRRHKLLLKQSISRSFTAPLKISEKRRFWLFCSDFQYIGRKACRQKRVRRKN
jgi:hypothetical protein